MTDKEISKDLYCKIVCALTHEVSACEHCLKCCKAAITGDTCGIEARMNIIEDLAMATGYDLPWIGKYMEDK